MTAEGPADRTVLVTGGAGFVGSHLVDALVPDNEVRVLDDLSTGSPSNLDDRATLIEGDIRDRAVLDRAMDGVDVAFHEAALVSVERSVEDPVESHAINVDATLSLLERARREDARVVFASSAAVYGHPDSIPVREDDHKAPTSPYGLDKLSADRYCRLYHDLYGLETVALRYFNVYGPRQRGGQYSGVISTFVRQALAGEPITVHGDGSQTRDFVHVSDAVGANLLAATTGRTGEAFNVATGESITIRGLAELIRGIAGSGSEIVHTDPREGDVDRSRADVAKARSELGYEPAVSLRDGLEELVERTARGSADG